MARTKKQETKARLGTFVAGKTSEELEALRELIAKEEEIIRRQEEKERKEAEKAERRKSSREVVSSKATGNGTYQWEATRCGSKGCHCEGPQGKPHGPYLYLRGVRNDPKGRKSIYIKKADYGKHPDAPACPSL